MYILARNLSYTRLTYHAFAMPLIQNEWQRAWQGRLVLHIISNTSWNKLPIKSLKNVARTNIGIVMDWKGVTVKNPPGISMSWGSECTELKCYSIRLCILYEYLTSALKPSQRGQDGFGKGV